MIKKQREKPIICCFIKDKTSKTQQKKQAGKLYNMR